MEYDNYPVVYDFFVICPVRGAEDEVASKIETWVRAKEANGKSVYWPARDTVQDQDPIGIQICTDNRAAILQSRTVAIWFSRESQGSMFDLGIAWALGKPLVVINEHEVGPQEVKSFENMMIAWSGRLFAWDLAGGSTLWVGIAELLKRQKAEAEEEVAEEEAATAEVDEALRAEQVDEVVTRAREKRDEIRDSGVL